MDVWSQGEAMSRVEQNTYMQVALAKHVRTLLPDQQDCSGAPDASDAYALCKLRRVAELAASGDMCYLPQLREWTEGNPACRDRQQAVATFAAFQAAILKVSVDSGCKEPCEIVYYHRKQRGRLMSGTVQHIQ